MSVRRFTGLTNAFSKKWENNWAAAALWFTFYNFCRVHKTLRVTPCNGSRNCGSRVECRRTPEGNGRNQTHTNTPLPRISKNPFKPCVQFSCTRLNDDLAGVACAGYFTVPRSSYSPIPANRHGSTFLSAGGAVLRGDPSIWPVEMIHIGVQLIELPFGIPRLEVVAPSPKHHPPAASELFTSIFV